MSHDLCAKAELLVLCFMFRIFNIYYIRLTKLSTALPRSALAELLLMFNQSLQFSPQNGMNPF